MLPVLPIGCPTDPLFDRADHLVRQNEQLVRGIGIFFLTPQPMTLGEQPIVVILAVGSRKEMSQVSAVWLTYQSPVSSMLQTVRMSPNVPYLDGFGALVPFTETGLWRLSIQIFRVGWAPATATFTVVCCAGPKIDTEVS
jgi:hypothetical protein